MNKIAELRLDLEVRPEGYAQGRDWIFSSTW